MATISKAKQQNFINGESFDAVDGATIQNEIFGPVITVQQFDDEAKAIEWANATRYGLAASVSTRDIGRAHRVGKRDPLRHRPDQRPHHDGHRDAPRRLQAVRPRQGKSKYALEDYTIVKHVMVNLEG